MNFECKFEDYKKSALFNSTTQYTVADNLSSARNKKWRHLQNFGSNFLTNKKLNPKKSSDKVSI